MTLACQFDWEACSQSNAWLHSEEPQTANQLSVLQMSPLLRLMSSQSVRTSAQDSSTQANRVASYKPTWVDSTVSSCMWGRMNPSQLNQTQAHMDNKVWRHTEQVVADVSITRLVWLFCSGKLWFSLLLQIHSNHVALLSKQKPPKSRAGSFISLLQTGHFILMAHSEERKFTACQVFLAALNQS